MYITDLACLSPQPTTDDTFWQGDVRVFTGHYYPAVDPSYGQVIPRNLLRKMGKAVKMGVWSGMQILERNGDCEGIIIGTADGAAENFVNFIGEILEYDEGTLTPTAFVQSAPNSLAGTLALMTKNTGYNATYVDKGSAFASALIDALMLFEEKQVSTLLVGNTEQYSSDAYHIESLSAFFKQQPVASNKLIHSQTPGTAFGEGSAMFALSAQPDRAYARVCDVTQTLYPSKDDLTSLVETFLEKNNRGPSDIDVLVLGWSGDNGTDHWYDDLRQELFPSSAVYSFKNLSGEYPSSTAFGLWLAAHILNGATIPEDCQIQASTSTPKNLLLYNHYRGIAHSLTLLTEGIGSA